MPKYKKLLPIILALVGWGYVVFNISPPSSLSEATPYQLAAFFIPFTLIIFFGSKFILHSNIKSLTVCIYILIALVLQGLDWAPIWITLPIGPAIFLIKNIISQRGRSKKEQDIPKLSKIG